MQFFKRPRVSNWCLYLAVLLIIASAAWVYGERLLYLALVVFAAMPAASLIITFLLLRGLQVTQDTPNTVVKAQESNIRLYIHNAAPAPLGNVQCTFFTDDFAIESEDRMVLALQALQSMQADIPFRIKYRGTYTVGIQYIHVIDLMGLFRLRRTINKKTKVIVLPRIVDMSGFPLVMNLLTQAHSRYDIKDEDYTTISDIRPYMPTDSIKRVHWKLTAKRNEWLVKNFQSNALNQVTMIFDTTLLPLRYKEQIILEDRMIETAMGLARFCLRKGMPVDFFVGEGHTAHCTHPASFEIIYSMGSGLVFSEKPRLTPQSMLAHCLNDATGFLNTVILTARPNADLYERIANGISNGHYIAILYFPTVYRDAEAEEIFDLLVDGGIPAYRVGDKSFITHNEEETAA
ncbi:MAG: DUF58 domain-containing protein [Defluviitaleaceae bacterium]|nr:DUF58 domain-containing protein [Defluviitaleaceae bacterium]MCL2274968.1 DUF58 domain-containing protein [Defluviitaleaceae bacterium]